LKLKEVWCSEVRSWLVSGITGKWIRRALESGGSVITSGVSQGWSGRNNVTQRSPSNESPSPHTPQNLTLSNKTKQSGLKRNSIVAAEKPRRAVTLRFPNKLDFVGISATNLNEYHVIVRIGLAKYQGSFNTLTFGANKPAIGSCRDGRLDLVYYRDPGLKAGQSFPFWTIQ